MKAEDMLKKASLKVTKTRKDVLDIFINVNHALDNHNIELNLDQIDRITLYRTLKSFEENGLIHKISDLNGNVKYAICDQVCIDQHQHIHHSHIHFHCDNCEKTFCVENVDIPKINLPKEFHVTGQNITLTGKCKECHDR
jgi:Fur family ferric uptake transcriptional regulator